MTTNVIKILGALGVAGALYLGAATPTSARVSTGPGWHHHQIHKPSPWGVPNNFYSRYHTGVAAGIERTISILAATRPSTIEKCKKIFEPSRSRNSAEAHLLVEGV